MSIGEPGLDRHLLNAERRGRLVETLGLSLRGRAVTLPVEYDQPGVLFTVLIALDVVDAPLGGGCFLQSDAAAAAGAPWPALPKLHPVPRPVRPGSHGRAVRAMASGPSSTEYRVIRPGEDY